MAVSFPRTFPIARFATARLTLPPPVSQTQLAGGQSQVRRLADDRWLGEFRTPALTRADLRTWLAWLYSLKGGVQTFYGYDPRFPYPAAYPHGFIGTVKAGGGGFTGAGDVDAIGTTGATISGLPAGFVLVAGDLLGLLEGAYRGLHRILEAATANGSGAVSVTVEPLIKTSVFTTAATVQFALPVCIMNLVAGSVEEPVGREPGPVSFQGIQKVI